MGCNFSGYSMMMYDVYRLSTTETDRILGYGGVRFVMVVPHTHRVVINDHDLLEYGDNWGSMT